MVSKYDEDISYGSKLLKVFRLLMAEKRRHYLSDLTEYLHCSQQTVLRLMLEIERELGESFVSGKDGRRRWYQIVPRRRPRRLGVDAEELRFLEICRDFAEPFLPDQIRRRVDSCLWELSLELADFGRISVPGRKNLAFFSKGYIDYTPHYDKIQNLLSAAAERHICRVTYKASGRAEARTHLFLPGMIGSMNGALYAIGTCLEADYKTPRYDTCLAVHRMTQVEVTAFFSTLPPPQFDPAGFGLPWHEPRTFRIRFKPGPSSDYVRERQWAASQRISDLPDGSLLLELTTCSEPELMAWVRSFGSEAELLYKDAETASAAPAVPAGPAAPAEAAEAADTKAEE